MAEQDEVLQSVLDKPDDDAPRLAYADWCDLQTDEPTSARGKFIRIQIGSAHFGQNVEPLIKFMLQSQEETLLRDYRQVWAAPIAPLVDDYVFDRGFVALITISARTFLESADQLFALAPIQHLNLTSMNEVADELFQSPYLSRIRSLQMDRCDLTDRQIQSFAASPNVTGLRWLSAGDNHIGMEGADAVAASSFLTGLAYARFSGNLIDLEEQYSQDNGNIVDRWLPDAAVLLERNHGYRPWLHRNSATVDAMPDRFRMELDTVSSES
jgi:uncharacterized protein (TIGR02996 family)